MVGRLMIWLKIPSFWQIDWLKVTEYHRYRLLDEICAWFQKSSVVITGAPEQESQASPRSYHNLTVKLNVNLSIVHSLGFLRRKQKCLNGKFVAFLENLGQTNLCFFNSCKERKKNVDFPKKISFWRSCYHHWILHGMRAVCHTIGWNPFQNSNLIFK